MNITPKQSMPTQYKTLNHLSSRDNHRVLEISKGVSQNGKVYPRVEIPGSRGEEKELWACKNSATLSQPDWLLPELRAPEMRAIRVHIHNALFLKPRKLSRNGFEPELVYIPPDEGPKFLRGQASSILRSTQILHLLPIKETEGLNGRRDPQSD